MRRGRKVFSGHYDNHPLWFDTLNRIWSLTYPIGTAASLDKDNLIKTARRKTGLQDLGPDFWDEPLERLIWSIEHEANLHPIGRFITRQRLINLLSVRLRAEWWFKAHPEILEQDLYPVWMIAGLQRTGTTKLQRLLSADPENRPLLSWEAINPVPVGKEMVHPDPRIRIARTSENALKLIAPDFFAIHPVEHQAPEEDILLLDVSFLSTTTEATMHVPAYAAWLEKTDQSLAYAYSAKLLKFLQWQRPARRWVLKSPHHLEFLPIIHKHFGDVRFLWTHRQVDQCIPSFLSMVSFSRAIFSNNIDPESVAAHWVRKTAFMLSKALAFRKMPGNESLFTDIFYEQFTDTPIDTMQAIYQENGKLSSQLKAQFEKANSTNPRGKYGSHHYKLSDFNLSAEDLSIQMAGYQQFIRNKMTQQN